MADPSFERLGAARDLVADADRRSVSAVSIWELAIKQRLGKLGLGADVRVWTRRLTAELALDHVPVTADHAAGVEHCPTCTATPSTGCWSPGPSPRERSC